MTMPQAAKEIVDAARGRLVGRTRLQKSAYFLEALGLGAGFDFSYHYYGPYSEDLAVAASDAEALGLIAVQWEATSTGLSYAVFNSIQPPNDDKIGVSQRRREILDVLNNYDAVSLELAATAHFLALNGHQEDPWKETRRRKTAKATEARVDKARRLITELGLQPIGRNSEAYSGIPE